MTRRRATWALLAVAVAACRPPATAAPLPSPAPATQPVPVAAPPAAPADSVVQRPAPPAAAAARDTAEVPRSEVAREAVKIFGDSVPVAEPDSAEAEPTWDIDVRSFETHQRVEWYVERFSHGMPRTFTNWLEQGTRFEPMIRAKLRAAGLPEDLTYLALIESGYDPHAYSSAAAVGMWQIMTATARGTGLRVDWWVDERRDPVRSTDGAIKFLGWLNDQFGSLYAAAAAYNGGPGRVSRGLTRYADELTGTTPDERMVELAGKNFLPAETREYVPKLIGAALVAKHPAHYGLTVRTLEPFAYDSVRVGPLTPLAAVAAASNATVQQITELNPHVLRGLTPPKDTFLVRVPVGAAAAFDSSFRALPEADRVGLTKTTTKKSETMAALAARTGVSARALGWYNRGLQVTKRGRVSPGQTVLVPTSAVLAAARDVPDPAVERYGSSSRGRAVTHVVKRGESLGSIAKKYHTTVAALRQLNGFRKSVIIPGQVIVVRGGSRASSSRSTSRSAASRSSSTAPKRPASAARSSTSAPGASAAPSASVHVVRSGETLGGIAKKYGLTVARLKALNGMSGNTIRVGQRLQVR